MCRLIVDLVFPSKPWAPSVHLVWVGLVTGVRTSKAKDGGGSQVVDSGVSVGGEWGGGFLVSGEFQNLTWDIVNIATIHKQVAILGVAQGR